MSSRPEFVYTTYIKTTPERLWQALTDPVSSRKYLGFVIESDWQTGSTYVWDQNGLKIAHPDQVIIEADPHRRLAFTFHTFVPELKSVVPTISEEFLAKAAAERRSKVSFDLEPHGDQVKLTIIHDDFEPDSEVLRMASHSWPVKLANLKTGLEQS